VLSRRYNTYDIDQQKEREAEALKVLEQRKELRRKHDELMRKPWKQPSAPRHDILRRGDGSRRRRAALAKSLEKAVIQIEDCNDRVLSWHRPAPSKSGIRSFIQQQRGLKGLGKPAEQTVRLPSKARPDWQDVKVEAARQFRVLVGGSLDPSASFANFVDRDNDHMRARTIDCASDLVLLREGIGQKLDVVRGHQTTFERTSDINSTSVLSRNANSDLCSFKASRIQNDSYLSEVGQAASSEHQMPISSEAIQCITANASGNELSGSPYSSASTSQQCMDLSFSALLRPQTEIVEVPSDDFESTIERPVHKKKLKRLAIVGDAVETRSASCGVSSTIPESSSFEELLDPAFRTVSRTPGRNVFGAEVLVQSSLPRLGCCASNDLEVIDGSMSTTHGREGRTGDGQSGVVGPATLSKPCHAGGLSTQACKVGLSEKDRHLELRDGAQIALQGHLTSRCEAVQDDRAMNSCPQDSAQTMSVSEVFDEGGLSSYSGHGVGHSIEACYNHSIDRLMQHLKSLQQLKEKVHAELSSAVTARSHGAVISACSGQADGQQRCSVSQAPASENPDSQGIAACGHCERCDSHVPAATPLVPGMAPSTTFLGREVRSKYPCLYSRRKYWTLTESHASTDWRSPHVLGCYRPEQMLYA
jgi:hypothetical protein